MATKAGTTRTKKKASKTAKRKSAAPANPKNPFKAGSSYNLCWQILWAHRKTGISRHELVKLQAKASKKDLKRAKFDCNVLLSAKESNSGPRHRSCREGFWVRRENDHVQLMID